MCHLQQTSAEDSSLVFSDARAAQDSEDASFSVEGGVQQQGLRAERQQAAVDDSDSVADRCSPLEEEQQELEPSSDGVTNRGASRRRQRQASPQHPACCHRHDGGASRRTQLATAALTASLLLLTTRGCCPPETPLAPSRRYSALLIAKGGETSSHESSSPLEGSTSSYLLDKKGSTSLRILQSPAEPSPTASPTVSPAPTISSQPSASPTMSRELTVEPAGGPASSPVNSPTADDAPSNPSPVASPPVEATMMPTVPVAPPPTGFPTTVVYTDMPTDEPAAGTFAPTTARPSSSYVLDPTAIPTPAPTPIPTPAPVSRSTLLPTSASSNADPTSPPTNWDTQAMATSAPSVQPSSGILPLSPFLDTAAPVRLTPAPIVTIPWTPPPVDALSDPTPDPTPAPVNRAPPTRRPNDAPDPTPVEPSSEPTVEPNEQPSDAASPTTTAPGPEGTEAPFAPTPRPAASSPSAPSDPSPTSPTGRPTRRPSRPTRGPSRPTSAASNPAAPTDAPQQQPHAGGVRPTSATREPSANLAQRPSPPSPSPTQEDQKSETAPVTAPTAALGYSYDMVRVGREGLEMSIGLSQSSQRRLGKGLGRFLAEGWSRAVSGRRQLQQGNVTDAALCTEIWAKYMEDITRYSVNQAVRGAELVDVEIQNVALDRLLDKAALMFFFDVQIRIRAPPAEHDVDKYISAPFDTDQEKQSFVDYLRNSDCKEFKYATSVTLIMPPSSNSVESQSSRPANTGLIVGIAAAAVAFAMLVSLFVYMKVKARRNYLYQEEEKVLAMMDEQPTHEYASEIGMRTSGDISTLSDPIPLAAVAHASRDGSTAGSFTLDYDFQKACHASVSEMSGGSQHEVTSRDYFSTDDGSLEAQYVSDEQLEVIAPAGVLGLILETNEDGIPVVNNVKASSVLSGHVQVGDRLLSVDGQDVTVMLASDVSKLIAFKKHKPERRLVFARSTRGRNNNNNRTSLLNEEVDPQQDQDSWLQGSTRSR